MTTYTQARQAEQENAANVRALTEQRKNAESVYKKTDGETFREYVARHKSAEGQKQLERIKQASDKETRAKIAQHFYRNNSRAAFVAEFLPTLENLLKKYAGKPYGDKTRDKIAQEFLTLTGARLYIQRERAAAHFPAVGVDSIEFYARKDNAPALFLIDNKINPLKAGEIHAAYIAEFCEDIPVAVENLIQKRAEIVNKAQELAKMCDDYNAATVGNLPLLDLRARFWSADVLTSEN